MNAMERSDCALVVLNQKRFNSFQLRFDILFVLLIGLDAKKLERPSQQHKLEEELKEFALQVLEYIPAPLDHIA